MNNEEQPYNIATIRELLLDTFGDGRDLHRFCQDRPTFQPILPLFGPGFSLLDMVDAVVDYCAEHLLLDELQTEVEAYTPPLPRPLTGREMRNRQAMLQLVRNTWVEGVLEQSLHGAAMIELGMEENAGAVEGPWDMVVQMPSQLQHPLPCGTRIADAFEEANGALLILGQPGSGKTTMLLELARDAIEQAERDPSQPIPVVFHLSSWAERQRPLTEWLVEELNAKYRIPRRNGRAWVEQDILLLLLDGLDEVHADHRQACVEAINEYCKEYGLGGIVVCCRAAEYEALGTKLKFGGAILIQPLIPEQVDDYLAAAGPRLDALRIALQQDATLQELAQTPLMLSVMALAYRDIQAEVLIPTQPDTPETSRQRLFAAYVDRMFTRLVRTRQESYTRGQTVTWLAWLARRMGQHNQSLFLMEGLQPSWLGTRARRWLYVVGSRAIWGLLIGLAMVPLLYGLSVFSGWIEATLLVASYLAAGVSVGLLDGLRFQRDSRWPVSRPSKKQRARPFIIYVTLIGLVATFGWVLVFLAPLGLPFGAFETLRLLILGFIFCGLPFGLICSLRGREQGAGSDVHTVETLNWSWRGFLLPLLVLGLAPGAITLAITSSAYDSGARLWDGRNGNPIAVLKGHTDLVNSASFSPDGTRILTASQDGTARLWDGRDGVPIAVLEGHTYSVNSASFSPDGTHIVTASQDGTARLWDGRNGDPIAMLEGHTFLVYSASFSPDGNRIVTASRDGTARLWDGINGDPIAVLAGYGYSVNSASFSPDGTRIVTAGSDHTARLWDGCNGDPIAVLEGHTDLVNSASFSPDGTRIVTASQDGTAHLWDGHNGDPIAVLDSLASFSPDETRIATASSDGIAGLFLEGHTFLLYSASFSPDGNRIVTVSQDGTARLWDGRDGAPIAVLEGHTDLVYSASFSPDGTRIVTASQDGTARLWNGRNGVPIAALEGHTDLVYSASFSPDGTRIVTAGSDRTARLWDGRNGDPVAVLEGDTSSVNRASFSPDGTRIVTAGAVIDNRPLAILWLVSGVLLGLLSGLRGAVQERKVSPNEGIRRSARNAAIVALTLGLTSTGLVVALLVGTNRSIDLEPWPLAAGFGCVAILSLLAYGGLDVLYHYLLRLIFAANGRIPWRYAKFLDYAAERIFLRKVGGGYIFVHRLLQEYFASLGTEGT